MALSEVPLCVFLLTLAVGGGVFDKRGEWGVAFSMTVALLIPKNLL